ncbi:MAG TPA: tetratricopeptide repeat protein [Candidatus Cloacimonadota bacterium]|nr:tetratricopeptide repeat protein [Candidatus Cloacimonadota bacterium]HQB40714.1 tetratricopeptide repeat protein [Candidatus Cloacimonadota bacterium]
MKNDTIHSTIKYSSLLILFLFAFSLLSAQYDEKAIMLNQAQSFENLNQLARAQQIYQDLLRKYPNDHIIVQRLYQSHFRLSEFDKADNLIENKKAVVSKVFYTQSKITLLCKNNRIEEAEALADSYIKDNPNLVNNYQFVAIVFEQNQLHELALKYYLSARKISNNGKLYAYEIANDYFQLMDYKSAIKEYVVNLEQNKPFLYITNSRFKEIIEKDSTLISLIEKYCASSNVEEVRELLALSLVELARYDDAINVYNSLSIDKFIKFADDLYAKAFYQVALQAYEMITEKLNNNPVKLAEIQYKIALVYYDKKDYEHAKSYVNQIIQTKELSNNQLKYRTKVHFEARLLYANMLIIENVKKEKVLEAYDDAEKFIFNTNDKKNISFQKVHYLTMKEYYKESEYLLNQTVQNEEYGSPIISKSLYYRYELYLMQNDDRADSLMTEFIINSPDDSATNDMLFLSVFVNSLAKDKKQSFLKAYRLKQIYQDAQAIEELRVLISDYQNDELKLLLAEWLLDDFQIDEAKTVYAGGFTNEVYTDFAKLELVRLEEEQGTRRSHITDYLISNPNGAFSPLFRQLLIKGYTNKGV